MQKQLLLEKFQTLSCVTSIGALEEYIDYCIEHSCDNSEKTVHSVHHILPQARTLPFKSYKNLNQHPWNRAILTHYHHYRAHHLLALAVDHLSTYTAFCGMHNKDVVLKRISLADLIPEEEFNILYKKRNSHLSDYWNTEVEHNGELVTRAKIRGRYNSENLSEAIRIRHSERMSGNNNIVHQTGVVDKIRKTKLENGLDKISAERAAETMKRPFLDSTGKETTIYEQNGRKLSATLNQVFIDDSGNETTLATERGKKKRVQMLRDGKWFCVKSVFDESLNMILPCALVRQISPALDKKTRDDYLGKSKFGQTTFRDSNREYLIGLYAEILPEAPENYTLSPHHSPYL
jgi:hypothetical protein